MNMRQSAYVRVPVSLSSCQLQALGAVLREQDSKHQLGCRERLHIRTKTLVLDWHRMAICCAGAGEASLYAANKAGLRRRKELVRLKGEDPIYAAHSLSSPHVAGREIKLEANKTFGVRRFTSDLPGNFGLRAVMVYLPGRTER